jgi:spoIIIJ-associated protein
MMTMEWVTITAATLDDAKNLALDQLGVAAEDAEFEIPEARIVRSHARRSSRARTSSPDECASEGTAS